MVSFAQTDFGMVGKTGRCRRKHWHSEFYLTQIADSKNSLPLRLHGKEAKYRTGLHLQIKTVANGSKKTYVFQAFNS